jgi:RimJ/RimL family protein N-acetyltransferase
MFPQPAERIEETLAFITRSQTSKQAGTELVITIHRRTDGEFLGGGGLHCTETPTTPELGIWLKSAAHGNGFGKEAVVGMMQWAEEHLEIESFIYPVDRRNVPSRKIPESLGGKIIAERNTPTVLGNLLDILVFSVPRQRTV